MQENTWIRVERSPRFALPLSAGAAPAPTWLHRAFVRTMIVVSALFSAAMVAALALAR